MAIKSAPTGKTTIEEAIELAVAAVNRGDMGKGKAALNWVLEQDPDNTTAWLWLACCMTDDEAKQNCYKHVSLITARY